MIVCGFSLSDTIYFKDVSCASVYSCASSIINTSYPSPSPPDDVLVRNSTTPPSRVYKCSFPNALNDDGLWMHQKYGYSVPRRNGKSENVLARCLWGLKNGERILYTAHRATTSHAVWERLDRMCEKAGIKISSSFTAIMSHCSNCCHSSSSFPVFAYVCNNSLIEKAKEFLKDIKEITPFI